MNLFPVNIDPIIAAQENCDAHCRKIILEVAEQMGYAYIDNGVFFDHIPQQNNIHLFPFQQHYKHPMSRYVRSGVMSFEWARQHFRALLDEFEYRFDKKHAYEAVYDWISNKPLVLPYSQEPWPRCFGKYKKEIKITDSVVADYQEYYRVAKRDFAKWTKRPIPQWFTL